MTTDDFSPLGQYSPLLPSSCSHANVEWQTIADALQDADETRLGLVAHIAVLAQLARLSPDAFEARSEDVIAFLVKRVLMVPCVDEVSTPPLPLYLIR